MWEKKKLYARLEDERPVDDSREVKLLFYPRRTLRRERRERVTLNEISEYENKDLEFARFVIARDTNAKFISHTDEIER